MTEKLRRVFYWVAIKVLWATIGVLLRLGVENADRIPKTGPAVLVSNHVSSMDPVVMGLASARPVSYMAKAELFEVFGFGALLRLLHVFPIRRGAGDRAALRVAGEVLKSGGVLGMFPEGTRQSGGVLGAPQPGAALLAIQSSAVIVPAAILGTDEYRKPNGKRFPKVTVRFAEPIYPGAEISDRRAEIDRLSNEMMDAIAQEGGFGR